uniref:ATP-binding cassette domain-containing protein n=1 Tax=uncultured Sulfitobacter sp. TaxID=191468 RepID=UPI0025934CE3
EGAFVRGCRFSAHHPHHSHLAHILEAHPAIYDYLTHPRLVGLVEELVGGTVRLEESEAVINSRAPDSTWDGHYGFHTGTRPDIGTYVENGLYHCTFVKTLTNLTDLGPDDGGTVCIAGSHKIKVSREEIIACAYEDRSLIHQVVAPAGSTLLFGEARWYRRLGWEQQARASARTYLAELPDGIFASLAARSLHEAEVIAAARKAEAHEFIEKMQDHTGRSGYDAHLGERGVKLSGGQRQRIALARAILKDAPILILDEATSALDSEVEAAIQSALTRVMEGKTVMAIAHRLSTLTEMDRIAVMDAGRIVEIGTHEALLAKDGLYARYWRRQSGGFLDMKAAE